MFSHKLPLAPLMGLWIAFSAQGFAATGEPESQNIPIDHRWLPWLGNWEPETDSTRESQNLEALRVLPAPDGISVTISAAGKPGELRDVLTPDGTRRPIDQLGCEGWRTATWSADGRRVFTRSVVTCGSESERSLSGLMMISPDGSWTHVQLAQTGDHRALWIQRYRYSGGPASALPGPSANAAAERRLAGAPLDAEDIIEAAGQVDSEVIEAALLETRSSFDIDSKLLQNLAKSSVSEQVIDLMVALSFPSRFVVENGAISEMGTPSTDGSARTGSYWPYYGYPSGYYGHLFHLGWYSPFYSYYDPWFFPYSPYWRVRPIYGGGSIIIPGGDVTPGLSSGGRLIEGRGYTRVREREPEADTTVRRARPRHGGGSSASSSGRSARSSGSSSGGNSSSSSGGGGSSGGSASPSGYSSGGSSSGGQAKPRH